MIEYYPGSKRKIEPVAPKAIEPLRWDAKPQKKWVGGKQVELYTIGAVCAALGRPAVTIRLWIRQGHLPQAPFKLPDKNGIRGRRLYTKEHVEALLTIATRHRIVDSARVEWVKHPTFAQEVVEAWSTITI